MIEQTERNQENGFFHKYINGTKGVISLFLAILMVPFVMLAGVLIDAARIRSATAIFDEALCNASNSTLGTYDQFLKERFGLLAIAQSSGDGSYNAQDFIEDTFTYYMQENLKTLNKAFTDYAAEAIGVYPLSEKEMLRTEILEYSKYTVPTKLIINGLSIDSIISSLTSSMSMATSVLDSMSSGINTADKFEICQTKFDEAVKKADDCKNKLNIGESSFSGFESAAAAYNSIVTEMLAKRAEAEAALRSAQSHQSTCQGDFDREAAANEAVLNEIADLENEKDAEGNPVDNSERIAEIREAHKDELAAYDKAAEDLEDAKKSTNSAKTTLEEVNVNYTAQLDTQRSTVGSSRDSYASALGALADALEQTGAAVKAAQDAMKDALDAGNALGQQLLQTSFDFSDEADKKAVKELEKHQKDAWDRGDHEAGWLWGDEIDKAKDASRKVDNAGKIATTGASAIVSKFVETDYLTQFQDLATKVRNLKASVEAYALASGDDYMADTAPLRLDMTLPIDKEGLEKEQENIRQEMTKSGLLSMLKAVGAFVKSLTDISLFSNGKLNANVDIANVRNNTVYGQSNVPAGDKELSERYKGLYGSVSGSNTGEQDIALDDAINTMIGYIDKVMSLIYDFENPGEKVVKVFTFIFELGKIVPDVIAQIKIIVNNIGRLGSVAYGRLLLAGYAGYNTANRTNYSGTALTGASFTTAAEESGSTALFCGAETEYVITGQSNELKSQKKVFHMVYQLRLAMDVPFVFANQEVASIATAAGSATFGIGTVIVYIMYIMLEPLVDALLLVNGGRVPLLKTKLYLSPSGFPSLINSIISLDLSEKAKNKMSKGCIDFMSAGNVDGNYSQRYADIIQSGVSDPEAGKSSKALDAVNLTYTKIMILILLFRRTDETVARLADVIQMEAAYYANGGADGGGGSSGGGSFSLNNSYTYIRSSGSFSGAYVFSPEKAPWASQGKHIVYRGY